MTLTSIWQRFFALLARATDSEHDLMLEYLKTENAILRSRLPTKIDLTPQEKQRLIKVGRPLGSALAELISIVAYRTFTRWLVKKMPPKTGSKGGRPCVDKRIRDLIVRIAGQVGWG